MSKDAVDDLPPKDDQLPQALPSRRSWACPYCDTMVFDGARVCTGCQAELVYGLTSKEASEALYMGLFAGGGGAVLLLFGGPSWINAKMGWHISPAFGLGIYVLFPIALSAFVAIRLFMKWRHATIAADSPRFTRRFNA